MYQWLFFYEGFFSSFFFASMPGRSLFFIWILEWSGKMEHAMERTLEWDSHGQMEPSSANYGPVQLIPMVTQMKDQALCISPCFLSIHDLFIWKFTPFARASRNGIREKWPPHGDCVWKNQSLWGRNITYCKEGCCYLCALSFSMLPEKDKNWGLRKITGTH